ncbi:MAG: transposase, partial [Verrucomicrobiota bacterium]
HAQELVGPCLAQLASASGKDALWKALANAVLSGVRVVTYCIMSNHLHLLLDVPEEGTLEPLDREGLVSVLPRLYDDIFVAGIKQEFDRAEKANDAEWQQKILDRFESRRGNLSQFMKELKQRITIFINKKEGRTGTLWEGRFKSVLVEGNEGALLTMAAYIDLNPVRAGIVGSPEEYRWSGLGEAAAGVVRARDGLGVMLDRALMDNRYTGSWAETEKLYRCYVYDQGREVTANADLGHKGRKGMSEEQVEAVIESGGVLSRLDALRCRVRYFSDGMVLGSKAFVNQVFDRERRENGRFGKKRKTGARSMQGADWGGLQVMRDLRCEVILQPEVLECER